MAQAFDIAFTRGENYDFDFHLIRGIETFLVEAAQSNPTFAEGTPAIPGVAGQYYFDLLTGTGYRHDGVVWGAQLSGSLRIEDLTRYKPRMQVRESAESDKTLLDSKLEGFLTKPSAYTLKFYLADDRTAKLPPFVGVYDLWLEDTLDTTQSFPVLAGSFTVRNRITRF